MWLRSWTGALARVRGVRVALLTCHLNNEGGNPRIPPLHRNVNNSELFNYLFALEETRQTRVAISLIPKCYGRLARARRDTYGRVEGEGALALEHPVARARHPDGGHVGDQQLSQVCSHLRIPASGTAVLPSRRSRRLSVEKGMLFLKRSVATFQQPEGRDVGGKHAEIKRRAARREGCCTANAPPCGLELALLLFQSCFFFFFVL